MKRKEFHALPCGIYRVFWKDGGESLASIGMSHKGLRWLAPTNWTEPVIWEGEVNKICKKILTVVLLGAEKTSREDWCQCKVTPRINGICVTCGMPRLNRTPETV